METIILVPGHGCTPQVFAAQMQALSEHYHCISIDLREYKTREAVIAAILKQAPEKFFILGFSLGAIIALEISQKVPERINGLIHISAPYEGPSAAFVQELKQIRETLPTMEISEFCKIAYHKYFPDKELSYPLYKTFSHMLLETGKTHYLEQANMLLEPWTLMPKAHAHHPVLIMGGALDHRALPQYHKFMATELPTAVLYLIPHARHFVTLEQPALSTQIISEWIENTAPKK